MTEPEFNPALAAARVAVAVDDDAECVGRFDAIVDGYGYAAARPRGGSRARKSTATRSRPMADEPLFNPPEPLDSDDDERCDDDSPPTRCPICGGRNPGDQSHLRCM